MPIALNSIAQPYLSSVATKRRCPAGMEIAHKGAIKCKHCNADSKPKMTRRPKAGSYFTTCSKCGKPT